MSVLMFPLRGDQRLVTLLSSLYRVRRLFTANPHGTKGTVYRWVEHIEEFDLRLSALAALLRYALSEVTKKSMASRTSESNDAARLNCPHEKSHSVSHRRLFKPRLAKACPGSTANGTLAACFPIAEMPRPAKPTARWRSEKKYGVRHPAATPKSGD